MVLRGIQTFKRAKRSCKKMSLHEFGTRIIWADEICVNKGKVHIKDTSLVARGGALVQRLKRHTAYKIQMDWTQSRRTGHRSQIILILIFLVAKQL